MINCGNSKKYLIIGGAGFIGSNTSYYFAKKGHLVTIFDNFSRQGSEANVRWLTSQNLPIKVVKGDIRYDQAVLDNEVKKCDFVLHLAAQVAVTTSVSNPREDFEINAQGTFNVLEAIRKSKNKPALIYTSTNKVYGGMETERIGLSTNSYYYRDWKNGIPETYPLDFHSPYGCSKGCADQYVRDYARIYGLKTVVFRQSCIYGPRQFGVEDQGWVAWFIIAAVCKKPMTIYGDGKQVRDVLYVEDLVRAYDMAFSKMAGVSGQVFNIGGGPKYTISIWRDFSKLLDKHLNTKLKVTYSDWRPGDQKIYVSDIRKAVKYLGWAPKVSPSEGIKIVCDWVKSNKPLFD